MSEPTTSRSIVKPIVAGLIVVLAVILIVGFRGPLWDAITESGEEKTGALSRWIPEHKGETVIIAAAFLVFIGINYIAHIAGRLRAWIFVAVVEVGLWILFWNSVGVTPLKDLIGLEERELSGVAQINSLIIIMILSGVVFWILEARESIQKRRHVTGGDD